MLSLTCGRFSLVPQRLPFQVSRARTLFTTFHTPFSDQVQLSLTTQHLSRNNVFERVQHTRNSENRGKLHVPVRHFGSFFQTVQQTHNEKTESTKLLKKFGLFFFLLSINGAFVLWNRKTLYDCESKEDAEETQKQKEEIIIEVS
jgi:hypothetical protein